MFSKEQIMPDRALDTLQGLHNVALETITPL